MVTGVEGRQDIAGYGAIFFSMIRSKLSRRHLGGFGPALIVVPALVSVLDVSPQHGVLLVVVSVVVSVVLPVSLYGR